MYLKEINKLSSEIMELTKFGDVFPRVQRIHKLSQKPRLNDNQQLVFNALVELYEHSTPLKEWKFQTPFMVLHMALGDPNGRDTFPGQVQTREQKNQEDQYKKAYNALTDKQQIEVIQMFIEWLSDKGVYDDE